MTKDDLIKAKDVFLADQQEDEKSKNTLIHYSHVLNVFIENMPDEISKLNIINFKGNMIEQGMKPSTINNYIVIINKFMKYIDQKDMTVKYIKVQKRASLDEVLEPIDLKRLLRTAKKMGKDDYYMIMKIFAYTGIRVKELEYFTGCT